LDAWPVSTSCAGAGWKATVYVRAYGGDCRYTYGWERQPKGGPMPGPMTFELFSPVLGAMVGEASVSSAGQTAKVGLHMRSPESCR
jgi:hypothetical protein